jgi:hypothetical protein
MGLKKGTKVGPVFYMKAHPCKICGNSALGKSKYCIDCKVDKMKGLIPKAINP